MSVFILTNWNIYGNSISEMGEDFMKVLSAVDKIIELRKHYKINQADLARGKISRSHLGMIEIGKTKLSRRAAEILVNNFNEIFVERGIDKQVTVDYILESQTDQLRKIREDFLSKLNGEEGDIDSIIEKIEHFASEFDPDTKIALYKAIGDKLSEKEFYKRAASYYLRILNDLIFLKDYRLLGIVSLDLIRIHLFYHNYDAVLDLEKLIKKEISNFNVEVRQKIIFNLALAYDGLKKFDSALDYYVSLDGIVKDPEKIFHLNNMRALCYEGLKEYEKAISLYRGMLLKYNEQGKKLIVSANLMYISQIQDNIDRCKFYLRKNKQLLEQFSEQDLGLDYLERIYFSMGEAAEYLNRNNEALKFYSKVFLTNADNLFVSNISIRYQAMERVLKLSTEKNIVLIKKVENVYFKLLEQKEELKFGYRFLYYYNKYNFISEQKSFLEKINKV